jgi:hypothetical protein
MLSALKLVLTSRKGVMAAFIVLISTIYSVGVVVAAVKGSITLDTALLRLFGPLLAQTFAALSVVWGVTTEDAAQKMGSSMGMGVATPSAGGDLKSIMKRADEIIAMQKTEAGADYQPGPESKP